MGKVKDELAGVFGGKQKKPVEKKEITTEVKEDTIQSEEPQKENTESALDDAIDTVGKKTSVQKASLDYSFQGVDYSIHSAEHKAPKKHVKKKNSVKRRHIKPPASSPTFT